MYNVYITAYQNSSDAIGKVYGRRKVKEVSISENIIVITFKNKKETLYFDRIDDVQVVEERFDDNDYEQERG